MPTLERRVNRVLVTDAALVGVHGIGRRTTGRRRSRLRRRDAESREPLLRASELLLSFLHFQILELCRIPLELGLVLRDARRDTRQFVLITALFVLDIIQFLQALDTG